MSRTLWRLVVRDQTATPFYSVDMSDVRQIPYFGDLANDAIGLGGGWMSMVCAGILGRSGVWRGPGFCVALDFSMLPVLRNRVATIVHEIAHAAEVGELV